jgi:hypothetical protein
LKIPKGGNQILFIEAEQTTQWPKEEFEDQIPYIEAEQTKQWPKDKSTKGGKVEISYINVDNF